MRKEQGNSIYFLGVILIGLAHFFGVKPQKNRALRGFAIEPVPKPFIISIRFGILAHLRRKTPQTGLSAAIFWL
ncbi:MAG: hypothetical protein LBT33_04100, partial [Spirochaetia bacterium]|nr:hypothetical protein [Spirochaetia bacterium]